MSESTDKIRLTGRLTMREVPDVEARYRSRFEAGELPESVNLAEVDDGDSSALALLLEWQSLASAAGRRVRFESPPEGLRVIARLTGVAPLLGWNAEGGGERGMQQGKGPLREERS